MNNTKTFFDNEPALELKDKYFVLTRGVGDDYKGAYATLISHLKQDLLRDYLKTRIGKLEINMDNTRKSIKKYNDGYFEYLLCDNTEYLIADYPDLVGKVVVVDGKFRTFDSVERAIKGASNGVNMGLYKKMLCKVMFIIILTTIIWHTSTHIMSFIFSGGLGLG